MSAKLQPDISDEDFPAYIRRCHARYMAQTEEPRKKEKENKGFYVGGKLQWRPGETESREGSGRPWTTINRVRPAVDQVTAQAAANPPGPEADPVGGGADSDDAQIMEGLVREYEYRCNANQARCKALEYACSGGRGLWEMATEYTDERSLEQQIVIKYVADPDEYFYDPDARLPAKNDSMWAGKIRKYTREALVAEIGEEKSGELKVLNRSFLDKIASAGGWIKEALGSGASDWSNWSSADSWTGANGSKGPYYVAEFYQVHIRQRKLTLYSDNILRFEDEPVAKGAKPKQDKTGETMSRYSPSREVWKYKTTALDLISKTRWYGSIPPYFWVCGPEIYVDGKIYRLSMVDGAKDAQRLLNYTASSVAEILGNMVKAPFIGPQGTFDIINAQGLNPWEGANKTNWAFLEYRPVFVTDEVTGQSHLAPPPERNTWEAPVARLMEVGTFSAEQIKAATSVFFEPSLISAQRAQSGEAIKALQQQTNIGTSYWQTALKNSTQLEYSEAALVMKEIYDGQRVRTIVRPDTTHEQAEINKEFPDGQAEDGKKQAKNNIAFGKFSFRVQVGPDNETRTKESLERILDAVKVMPVVVQNPAAAAELIRLIGEGNPDVEAFADLISPPNGADGMSPEQTQQAFKTLQAQMQMKDQMIQQLSMKLAVGQPKIDADERKNIRDNVVKLAIAEVTASQDTDRQTAELLSGHLETQLGMAHEAAMQSVDHDHEQSIANKQAQLASAQSAQEADQNSAQSAQDASQTAVTTPAPQDS